MKKIIVIIAAVLLSLPSFAQSGKNGVKWYDMQEAQKLNSQNPKKFLVYVYSDNCGWCRRMSSKTFADSVVAAYLNKNYYPVKINTNHSEDITVGNHTYKRVKADPVNRTPSYHEFVVTLLQGRMAYPSTAFLDKDLSFMGVTRGYKNPEDFEILLHYVAEEAYKETPDFEKYAEDFKQRN